MPRGTSQADEMRLQGRMDPDALLYIAKVERADKAALESGVKEAINNFVTNCKSTGLWDRLSLIAIMAGARSLTGALTVLKGPVSTLVNTNFTLSDYSRKNGFTGDGTTKTMTTGTYYFSAEATNDYHLAVNITTLDTTSNSPVWGAGGTIWDQAQTHNRGVRSRVSSGDLAVPYFNTGPSILSRDNSSTFNWRNSKITSVMTQTSVSSDGPESIRLWRSASVFSTNVMNYFSSGKSISQLGTYEDLINTLLTDIGRAVN
jgi:hypothetical protein